MIGGSWRLGRVFGITLRIDYSWLLIFALVTWSLGATLFPERYPEWSQWQYWTVGLATSLLFFASVIAHELAHSVVARASGVEVQSITLFVLGGVARIVDEPDDAVTEFNIAIVGPLSSLVLASLFYIIFLIAQNISAPLAAGARYLAGINATLAIFNLLPGFPLDGGRVLRAGLWSFTDNLRRATQWASMTGQAIAFTLIFIGLLWTLRGGLDGLWFVFIGWFLQDAARTAYRQIVVREMLQDVPISRLMTHNYHPVSPDLTLDQVVSQYVLGSDDHAYPVIENDKLVSIVCLHDIRVVPSAERSNTTVRETMSTDLHTVQAQDDAAQALNLLTAHELRQLPVIENGQLVGMIRRSDILRFLRFQAEFAPS